MRELTTDDWIDDELEFLRMLSDPGGLLDEWKKNVNSKVVFSLFYVIESRRVRASIQRRGASMTKIQILDELKGLYLQFIAKPTMKIFKMMVLEVLILLFSSNETRRDNRLLFQEFSLAILTVMKKNWDSYDETFHDFEEAVATKVRIALMTRSEDGDKKASKFIIEKQRDLLNEYKKQYRLRRLTKTQRSKIMTEFALSFRTVAEVLEFGLYNTEDHNSEQNSEVQKNDFRLEAAPDIVPSFNRNPVDF
ncbi:hypothetical protein Ciccas_009374 [Cichlidogyrus casuarinus]|uniref:Uncharacterized protein n=1 Tax=Cichlidogyrus casuarinus TaxID=1844966 RepID=A0ABD2PXP1_9PLAT